MLAPLASMVSGPLIIVAVISRLTPVGQGYFYTFNSLLAFQILFDMGSAQVLLQFASHEWSLLGLDEAGKIHGNADALAKPRSLLRFAIRWAGGIAALAWIVLGLTGGTMFSNSAGRAPVSWFGPWTALCTITALNMVMTPIWALLEGCNRIEQVYAYRFFANVAQNTCICCALFAGLSCGRFLWVRLQRFASLPACSCRGTGSSSRRSTGADIRRQFPGGTIFGPCNGVSRLVGGAAFV